MKIAPMSETLPRPTLDEIVERKWAQQQDAARAIGGLILLEWEHWDFYLKGQREKETCTAHRISSLR